MNVFCCFHWTIRLVVDSRVDSGSGSTLVEFIDNICPPPPPHHTRPHIMSLCFQRRYRGEEECDSVHQTIYCFFTLLYITLHYVTYGIHGYSGLAIDCINRLTSRRNGFFWVVGRLHAHFTENPPRFHFNVHSSSYGDRFLYGDNSSWGS
jgi:hypothetical protein